MRGALAAIAALLVAGCAGGSGQDDASPGVRLDDLQECDLRWSDGTPAPCETTVEELAVAAGRPPLPWTCLRSYQTNDERVSLYRHPVTEEYAVATALSGTAGVPIGLVGDEHPTAVWRPIEGQMSHAVIGTGDLLNTRFNVMHIRLDTQNDRLEAASLEVDVLTGDRDASIVLHAHGDATYHFSPLGAGYLGHAQFTFFGSIGIGTLLFGGDDFRADVETRTSGDFWMATPLTPNCNA